MDKKANVSEKTGVFPARFTMVEFPTGSAQASAEFMHDVLGFGHTAYGPDYIDVDMGGGHSLGFQQDRAEAPSAPLAIFEVDDLAAAQQAVIDAGGQVTVEPFGFPGGRRFHFREPGGNELAIWVRVPSAE